MIQRGGSTALARQNLLRGGADALDVPPDAFHGLATGEERKRQQEAQRHRKNSCHLSFSLHFRLTDDVVDDFALLGFAQLFPGYLFKIHGIFP